MAHFQKGYMRPWEEAVSLSACWKYFLLWQAYWVPHCVLNATDHGWGGLSNSAHRFQVFCFMCCDVMSYCDVVSCCGVMSCCDVILCCDVVFCCDVILCFDVHMELGFSCLPNKQHMLMSCCAYSHFTL